MCSLYLYYHEDKNLFMDDWGEVVYDIFSMITPQDLFLFHNDHKFNEFAMVGQEDISCQLVVIPTDELSSLYWLPEINIERFLESLRSD